MTNNKDVYVTNIEQAITVKIKNYVDLEVASDHTGNTEHIVLSVAPN